MLNRFAPQAETAYEGDAFHAQLAEACPANVWLLNPSGRIVYVNSAARRLRTSAPNDPAQDWRDIWPSACRASVDLAVREARAGRAFSFRARLSRSEGAEDGAGLYLNTLVSAVRDDQGRIVRLLAKSEDVTAETESSAFLNTVIDVLPLALTVKDARTGRFILANRAAETLFDRVGGLAGLKPAEVLPSSLAEWTAAAMTRGRETAVHEDHGRGGVRYLEATKVATYDDDGLRHLIGLAEDVTQRQRDADALRSALEQAERANHARSAFISNITHEIRTPLNGVIAGADLLDSRADTVDIREIAAMIRASATSLQHRFEDLMAVSRMGAAPSAPKAEPFEPTAFAEQLVAPHRAAAEAKGLALHLEISPDLPARLLGDAEALGRILTPLLQNGLKFTDRGEIRLRIEGRENGVIRFACLDTGVGFAPEKKDALFTPFHQSDDALTRRFGGMGLGLALAREQARAMGGEVDGEPREGGGSVFWLDIPLAAVCDDPGAAAAQGRMNVLVVDDHPTNRRIVEMMLDGVADVVMAEDGVEAVEAVERERFDLILMDIQMPRMDGITAVARIRDQEQAAGRPPAPIIMLTANTQAEHVAACREAGANRHLGKPFTSAGLFGEIQAVMGH